MIKLEHLIQGYNFNRIQAKVDKEFNDSNEKAVVINFSSDINGAFLLDKEDIVVAVNLYANGVVQDNKTLDNQIKHTTETLIIIQKTMELVGNIKQEEANNILKQLGLFKGKIKDKAVRFLNYVYRIDAANGLLHFSMLEEEQK